MFYASLTSLFLSAIGQLDNFFKFIHFGPFLDGVTFSRHDVIT